CSFVAPRGVAFLSCAGSPSHATYPRYVLDMNGDGLPDILGFHQQEIYVSLSTGSRFDGPQSWLHCFFTADCPGSGFNNDDIHPRYVVDVNGDGLPDIVGFSDAGADVSLNIGGSSFAPPRHRGDVCPFGHDCRWPGN